MAGVAILKHMRNPSDEVLRERWLERFLLPAVLQRGILPVSAALRPLLDDMLAPMTW